MARGRARIETGAAWVAYRRDLARAGVQPLADNSGSNTDPPAPIVPGSSWYRSTLWPDARQISSGSGGWWDDADTSADDEATASVSLTLATRS